MVNMVIQDMAPQKKAIKMGGVEVTAIDRIPFEKKLACAAQIATQTRSEDAVSGVVICAADASVTEMQAMLMFYTDVNVEGMSKDTLYRLYDMLSYDPQYEQLRGFVARDFSQVLEISSVMQDVLERRIEKKNAGDPLSLLGAYLSDPKPEETIAQGREINEYLIDLIGKAQKYDAQVAAVQGGIQGNLRNGAISYAKKG